MFQKNIFRKTKIVLFMIFVFLLVNPVFADGFMIEPDPEETVWDQWVGEEIQGRNLSVGRLVGEAAQQAFLKWDDKEKKETMMIIVDKDQGKMNDYARRRTNQNSLYWIVPIQSKCEDIQPYHYDKFKTNIEIINLKDEAKNRINKVKEYALNWQIWPLLGKLTKKDRYLQKNTGYLMDSATSLGGRSVEEEEVKVFKSVESYGVKTEVISTESSKALESYLRGYNIKLNDDLLDKIDAYINPNYCFAVSRVVEHGDKDKLAVVLDFKPVTPFYPMYITSAYGNKKINVDVSVGGTFQAKIGQEVTKVNYNYLKSDLTYGKDNELFFEKGDILTRYQVYESANNFKSDLYFFKSVPNSILNALKLWMWLIFILLMVLISFLLSFIIFRKKWIIVGAANGVIGIFGLIISQLKFKNIFSRETIIKTFEESRGHRILNYIDKVNKIILAIPLLMLILIPLALFGMHDLVDFLGDFMEDVFNEPEFAVIFFTLFLPIGFILSLLSLLMKKILSESSVDINTRKLLLKISLYIMNLLQGVLIVSTLILFIAMGPKGWFTGFILIVVFLFVLLYSNTKKSLIQKIMLYYPIAGIIIMFFDIFAGIAFIFSVYPFYIGRHYLNNADEISESLQLNDSDSVNNGQTEENWQKNIPRIILFSVLYVAICMVMVKIIEIFL